MSDCLLVKFEKERANHAKHVEASMLDNVQLTFRSTSMGATFIYEKNHRLSIGIKTMCHWWQNGYITLTKVEFT